MIRTAILAAMQQALEALETLDCSDSYKTHNAAVALRVALAEQAEQERKYGELAGTHNWTPPNYTDEQWQKLDQEYQDHVAEQEPVAWAYIDADGSFMDALDRQHGAYKTPLYAAPVRVQDLTDDEIAEIVTELDSKLIMRDATELEIARAVIAADRRKNRC